MSDKCVKEGFLQLILEGKETGLYFDFARGEISGTARRLPEPSSVTKEKKAKREKKAIEATPDIPL